MLNQRSLRTPAISSTKEFTCTNITDEEVALINIGNVRPVSRCSSINNCNSAGSCHPTSIAGSSSNGGRTCIQSKDFTSNYSSHVFII